MTKDKKEHPHAIALREEALSYPETHETFPWGHRVIKVRTKSFVFFGGDDDDFSLSVKLPESGAAALTLPFAEPTGYGLGKSGWVSARFPAGKPLPLPILRAWIDESYRAIAPKTLVAKLDGASSKLASKLASKPASKPASKSASKSASKPAAKPASKPAAKRTRRSQAE